MRFYYLVILLLFSTNTIAQKTINVFISNANPLVGDAFSIICSAQDQKTFPSPIQQFECYPANFLSADSAFNNKPCDYLEIISIEDSTYTKQGTYYAQRTFKIIAWDSCELALVGFDYKIGDQSVSSQQAYIKVSYYQEREGAEIYDIKETFHKWPKKKATSDRMYAFYVLGLIVIALITFLLYRKFKRTKKELAIIVPIEDKAINALNKLFNEALWKENKIQEHFVRFSFILRDYLTKRYHVSFLEKTTTQSVLLLDHLSIDLHLKEQIIELLKASDYIKFADSNIDEVSILQLQEKALKVIQLTIHIKDQIDD